MSKRREEIEKLQKQYEQKSAQKYEDMLQGAAAASNDAKRAVQESKPKYSSSWLQREKQRSRLSAANAMFSLIGQGLMASAGVDPGEAPHVMNLSESLKKADEDYRYDSREYSKNRIREAMHREDLYKDLAKSQLSFDSKDADRQSREKIASERNEVAIDALESRESMAEDEQASRKELQKMRSDATAALQKSRKEERLAKEQRDRTMPKEPFMFINNSKKERLPIYENEFIELYDDAHWRGLLNNYHDARGVSQRDNELRRAVQRAYDLRESGVPIAPLNSGSIINAKAKKSK